MLADIAEIVSSVTIFGGKRCLMKGASASPLKGSG